MNKTNIEWVKNPDGTQGYTSNPVQGKCPVGCSYCYAEQIKHRFGWDTRLTYRKQELTTIRKRIKPAGIFMGSMMELFHDNTIGVMPDIMETVRACPQHRFYFLTKCPQNYKDFSPFPDNCWVGVTTTDEGMMIRAINKLKKIMAKVKYLSFEPLLESMMYPVDALYLKDAGINWVIIGAQTKPYKPPKIEWVKEIIEACDRAGIPVFLKNNLMPLMKNIYDEAGCISNFFTGGDGETPVLRQEIPIEKQVDNAKDN